MIFETLLKTSELNSFDSSFKQPINSSLILLTAFKVIHVVLNNPIHFLGGDIKILAQLTD